VRVGEGAGSVTTDAAVTVSPRSTSGDTVTGYPLRLADVTGGTADGGSGAGSGGDTCEPDAAGGAAGSGLSLTDLLWLAAALAVATPFAMAEVERRRVRRRLSDLVDETPDGPAPRITVPA
jgi:hypothetical protein